MGVFETKILELICTDVHSIWQTHSELCLASNLQGLEQDKHKTLSAIISFLSTLKPKALASDRDGLFIPDLQTEVPALH